MVSSTGTTTRFDFFYDDKGDVIGFKYNGANYFYIKNLQGDITDIVDSTGTVVVSYTYDTWGVVKSTTGTMRSTIGNKNPFRYRSYYYDTDLALYYLNSRYYDPDTGRFINADAYVSTGQGVLSHNMFAYCLNNPVNRIDFTGQDSTLLQGWTSTMWWLCAVDSVLPIGDLTYALGICVLGGYALYTNLTATASSTDITTIPQIIDIAIPDTRADELDDVLPAPPPKVGNTYYHVTSIENSLSIAATNTMTGSIWEGNYVYAWKTKPSKKAIKNSGATKAEVIISFKTATSFVKDIGIINPKVQKYGPVVSVMPGPIVVWDVQVVEVI